ncbi:hypothetical protein C0J52_13112 [Blattella germanica]|nr:hypothetical protein C0J52_13112 [Blattella germanica]
MTFSLFRVAWTLLHFLLSAVQFIECSLGFVRRKYEDLLHKGCVENELSLISNHVKLLEKIPSHLVVILGNESVSYRDLANITVWCIAAGISFISFYDHHGVLKRNEAEFFKVLTEIRKGHIENIIWGKKTATHGVLKKNGTKNGITPSQKICVNIFSLSDGKGAVVELTKSLCRSTLTSQLKSSNINEALIQEKLQAETEIPDPDLALYCGDIFSTYGFLPWQIHVTEFLQLHSHHKIRVKDFIVLLEKYGKCVQRFGK